MDNQLPLIIYAQPDSWPRRRVCDLPPEERPQYRLHQHGVEALSTTELLALLLGTAKAPGLAQDLLDQMGSLHQLARASKPQLMRIQGIGEAQASRILAFLELSRRLQTPAPDKEVRITSPADGANLLMARLRDLDQEELHIILLDTRNRVLMTQVLYRGSLNTSVVRIAEIYRTAIEAAAAAIILVHNHPSGDPSPSPEDISLTRQIVTAGELLGITLLDHLIIGNGRFTSLKEQGAAFS